MSNMAVNCLAGKILFMLSTWEFEEIEGEMMRQVYKAFIVEVGLKGDVLQHNFKIFGELATKGTWFHNLWEFICQLKVTIEIYSKAHLQPARAGDSPIMEKCVDLSLDKNILCRLNRVQNF